jgi:hypothetical protein
LGTIESGGGAKTPQVKTRDGVATVAVGNVLFAMWKAGASVERWRICVVSELEALMQKYPEGIIHVQLILPSSSPPNGATRTAVQTDVRRIGPKMRRLVTVAIGDSIWQSVVRTLVRTMLLLSGHAKQQVVAATVGEGLDKVAEVAPRGPSRAELQAGVDALYAALDAVDRAA